VEFAVNDANDETEGNCYESLVLKALNANNKPAVILLFSVFMNDWNLQDRLAPVGQHYDLPMVSVKEAVVEQFRWTADQGKVISKKQFFYDIYHPANAGHGGFRETDTDLHTANMDDHTYGTPQFPNNWMHTAESGADRFKMTD